MIRLIKTELKKIFHKKSFYIVTFIFILYAILTNVIYKNIPSYVYTEAPDAYENEINNNNLDLTKEEDRIIYVSNKTYEEIANLKKKYSSSNEQYIIDNFLYSVIYDSYKEKYLNNNEEMYQALRTKIDSYISKIEVNEWQFFTNLKIAEMQSLLKTTTDPKTKERYSEIIKLEEYRLDKNINYDTDNYLNNAILSIEENNFEYYNLKDNNNLNKEEQGRFDYLEENYLTNKYILENQKDINNSMTLRAVLKNFPSEFGLFILIYVIMISGSIVSEEFNKGTIKYLLTKPYKRSTILTSKLFTILLLIPIIILFMILIEVLIGGVILGFDSLNVPVLIYDIATHSLVEYSLFGYVFKMLICNLPIYIILAVLCFMLSTITASTSAAITITFLFYLMSNVISNLALVYNIKLFKAFVSLHWDFSYLVNLTKHPFHMDTWVSILVVLAYIFIMLCLAYVYFNKKDVKNI